MKMIFIQTVPNAEAIGLKNARSAGTAANGETRKE